MNIPSKGEFGLVIGHSIFLTAEDAPWLKVKTDAHGWNATVCEDLANSISEEIGEIETKCSLVEFDHSDTEEEVLAKL